MAYTHEAVNGDIVEKKNEIECTAKEANKVFSLINLINAKY